MHALLLALPLLGQVALPPARQVIIDIVAHTVADREELERRNLSYTKTQKIYDTKGRVVPELKESKTWLMWYEDGQSRQQLIKPNGSAIAGSRSESPGPDWFVRLSTMYDFSWHRNPVRIIDNRRTYVIEFNPKRKLPRTQTTAENGLIRMSGLMYIDVEHRYIKTLECSLPKSFRKALVLKVNTASASFSQRLHEGLVVFDHMIIKVNYAVFGVETHSTYVLTYDSFGPREEPQPPDY